MEDERILERDTESLPVRLTTDELAQCGTHIGRRMDDRAREEDDFEAAKESHKGRLKRIEGDISEIGRMLSTGVEYRQVATTTVLNWPAEKVETRRDDTGAVIHTRPLRPEERQQELFRRKELEAGKIGGEGIDASPEAIERAERALGKR